MSSANVVIRIANLSLVLVGHIRGGLSQVVTVFSMFFSDMSGSTTADVAVMSRALAGPMKKEGYEGPFIAALIAAASTIATLVPPSITAVVYGATGNVSIAGLFLAGCAGRLDWHRADDLLLLFRSGRLQTTTRFVRRIRSRPTATPCSADDPGHHLGGILPAGSHQRKPVSSPRLHWITSHIPRSTSAIYGIFLTILPDGTALLIPLITIGAATAFGCLFAYLRGRRHLGVDHTLAGNDPHPDHAAADAAVHYRRRFHRPVPTIIIFMPLIIDLTNRRNINPVHMGVVLITTLAFGLITPPYGLVC